jgi:hypothetical protein
MHEESLLKTDIISIKTPSIKVRNIKVPNIIIPSIKENIAETFALKVDIINSSIEDKNSNVFFKNAFKDELIKCDNTQIENIEAYKNTWCYNENKKEDEAFSELRKAVSSLDKSYYQIDDVTECEFTAGETIKESKILNTNYISFETIYDTNFNNTSIKIPSRYYNSLKPISEQSDISISEQSDISISEQFDESIYKQLVDDEIEIEKKLNILEIRDEDLEGFN